MAFAICLFEQYLNGPKETFNESVLFPSRFSVSWFSNQTGVMYENMTAVVNSTDMIIHNIVIPLAIFVVVVAT